MAEMDFEYATAVADRALKSMSQLAVPATPSNFSVWFNYALGTSPALRKTIDILVGNKRKFDASINRELYTTYIDDKSDFVQVPDQLQCLVNNARKFLTGAIADNRTQIEILGEVSSDALSAADPKPIIEKLINELSKATTRASTLETSFEKASAELDTIRDSLKTAEQRSNTDALTGLANRRALEEFFRSAQISAMETGEPLSILMIDIDHFKGFNDTYGHQVGDQVLRLVSKVLQDSVRDVDLAARYGGEELIAVLPGAGLAVCVAVAERIRQRISDARLTRRTSGEEIASVTVSIGVSQFRLAESADAMVERCDRALYLAKRLGRNRTVSENEINFAK